MFRPASVLAAALLSVPFSAHALESGPKSPLPMFDLQRLRLDPAALGSLVVGTGRTLEAGQLRVALNYHYEQLPLHFQTRWEPGEGTGLVENKMTAHLTVGFGVLSWLEVGGELPLVLTQGGKPTLEYYGPNSGGIATPWLTARAAVLRQTKGAPINLSVGFTAGLPVGSRAAQAHEDYAWQPRLQLGYVGEGFQVGGEAGIFLRKRQDLGPVSYDPKDIAGNELRLGATVTSLHGELTRGEVSVLTGIPLNGGRVGAELLIAIRRHALSSLDLYVMGGPGVGAGFDTPTFRFVAGVSWATSKVD
ncbi:flagellar motor protein MotB [Corallococcus exiguus]|nr:flagellar motor protein MotB [Corallococcus exiguus]RKH17831.1 flagellar motor protein MotB [Corallococcus sp. CA041A]RKI07863.1 flagellar motor protein MotB [Corallococcus sp. AB030]RUO90585.1 flagellar motor protein MotB [Corallococcus sp. AB018]NRD57708.1 flagellar motor protein MotB [Corallococcus exiguus]